MLNRLWCRIYIFSAVLILALSGPSNFSPAQASPLFIELNLDPTTISFNVNPVVGSYNQTKTATVSANRPWQLLVRKTRELTDEGAGRTIPSNQFKFTAPAQPDPVEFSFTDTLVSQGEETTGTDTSISYNLTIGWDDVVGNYEAEQIYTVIPSLEEEMAGGISIDNGAEFTNDATVSIETSVAHAGFMRFSTDGTAWTDWQVYAPAVTMALTTEDGTKTILAEFKRREDSINIFEASSSIFLDTQAPTQANLSAPVYASDSSTDTTFVVSWSATDTSPSSGLAFDIQYKDSTTGAWTAWLTSTETTSAKFVGTAGKTYYFRAQSTDKAGNTNGAWSSMQSVTVVPYDQSVAVYSGTWSTQNDTSLYQGSSRYTTESKARATYNFSSAYEVGLIITKRSNGGRADIYIGTTKITTVDFYSAATQFRVPVSIRTYTSPTSGQLQVRWINSKSGSSSGHRVELDGIAIKK